MLVQASDMVSTSRILVAVVQMCYEAKDWDALNENIMLLSKRRSQLKQVLPFPRPPKTKSENKCPSPSKTNFVKVFISTNLINHEYFKPSNMLNALHNDTQVSTFKNYFC